ncbi:MAG: beta-lactamase family protein [Actinomycetia bacterium]|nr:beta-lactamase family protein [Actinomycetes bacterium]
MKSELDGLLSQAVDKGHVPGVTAMVVDRGGVTYEGGFGERALGSGIEMTPDTVGAIFSMTKALTGAAAMQLVERGELDLDAPAADVCDELAGTQVLTGFDGDGAPITRPPATPITLRNLLTHTSGFVYEIWNADLGRYLETTGTPSVLSLEKQALGVPLMFDPGTRWEYGIGIDWAGQMIETVSALTLGEFLAENLTGPLGMTDTGFAHTPAMLERAAAIHARTPDGSLTPIDLPAPENPEFEMGGGGMHGTMGDYARFIGMMLNDGELDGTRVLNPDTVAAMSANQIGDLRVQPLLTENPGFSEDAEFFPGSPKSWGLSFQINEEPASTGRPAGTLMWAGLANSFFWIDRQNGIGGCYLTQILPFADPGTLDTYLGFEKAVYANR